MLLFPSTCMLHPQVQAFSFNFHIRSFKYYWFTYILLETCSVGKWKTVANSKADTTVWESQYTLSYIVASRDSCRPPLAEVSVRFIERKMVIFLLAMANNIFQFGECFSFFI